VWITDYRFEVSIRFQVCTENCIVFDGTGFLGLTYVTGNNLVPRSKQPLVSELDLENRKEGLGDWLGLRVPSEWNVWNL